MLVICSGRGRLCAAAAVLVQLQVLALSQRRAAAQGVSEILVYGKIIHVQRSISSACCSVGLDSCRSACPLSRDANTGVMLRALHGVLPTVRAESGAAARAFFARFLGS